MAIAKNQFGVRTILAQNKFVANTKHKKWAVNGVLVSDVFLNAVYPTEGTWWMEIVWQLKDGVTYHYVGSLTPNLPNPPFESYITLLNGGFPTNYNGEAYNSFARKILTLKIPDADYEAWKASLP